jgi:trans-2,3-dihydro-3-hydroxyanthranilate isomerase
MRRRELMMSLAASAPRTFRYEVWDVFTRQPLTGNPLCVFLDARGMTDAEMQSIARETNLSETTFVLPGSGKGPRVRIFSPTTEYPFAGHPTLGTALALRQTGQRQIVLEENIGPIPVDFSERDGVFGDMLQTDPILAETHEPDKIAALLGCPASAFLADRPIVNISTGRPNLIVLFKNLAAMRSVQPDWRAVERYFSGGDPARGFYFLTPETESHTAQFHARKLNARGEDPATGSAAGCAAAYLVQFGLVPSGKQLLIEQGTELKRPSELYVSAVKQGGKIGNVRVGGYGTRVMRGELSLA